MLMNDPLRPFIPSYKGHVASDDGESTFSLFFYLYERLIMMLNLFCVSELFFSIRVSSAGGLAWQLQQPFRHGLQTWSANLS